MWCHSQLLLLVVWHSARAWAQCQSLQCLPAEYNPDIELDAPHLIRKYGYPVETHTVTTADGFILTLHRIPHGRKMSKTSADGTGNRIENEIKSKEPVLMQHGLLASSACWILAPPEKAPAYIMADAGYDVWLSNSRGNHYSRNHTHLSPDDKHFWDFSWDEMGSLDLPAVIDYILATTRHEQLYYIGHSMGTTIFFACMATKPEYNSKVKAMFGLGPVATVGHVTSPIKYLAPITSTIEELLELLGDYEFLPHNENFIKWTEYICDSFEYEEIMCMNAVFFLTGYDAAQINMTWLPVIFGHTPEGTSIRTLAHYAQEILNGQFQHYDFGKTENMRRYNQTTPPLYDLSRVNVPVVLMWGKNDLLADPKDVALLAEKLPNLLVSYKVPLPKFNHIDFIWGIDAGRYVYRVILKYMKHL
nr:gastric triacylglycerol lipase-like isoform X4 [Procambarus clarkii]